MASHALRSRTIRFNIIMGGIQAVNGSLAMWQPFLEPEQYMALATVLAMVQSMGAVWLRYLTSEPMSNK